MVFGRSKNPRPKREYCALEWQTVQEICTRSRKNGEPYIDSVIGRAVLTIAYTTGTRVGGILPSRRKSQASRHSPITRLNLRKVKNQ